jgi:hypothetical protein
MSTQSLSGTKWPRHIREGEGTSQFGFVKVSDLADPMNLSLND